MPNRPKRSPKPTPDTDDLSAKEDAARARELVEKADRMVLNSRQNEEELRRAIKVFTHALTLKPDLVDALVGRANAHADLEEYDLAMADCDRAIRILPNFAAAWRQRGEIHGNREKYDAAIRDYNRAVELDPDDYFGRTQRGWLFAELEKWEEALADFDKALELEPDEATVHFDRAECLANLGRDDEAIEGYTAGLRIDSDWSFKVNARGECYLKTGQLREAIADFTAAIKLDSYPTFYLNRAAAYRELGEFNKATADEAQAEELENTRREAPETQRAGSTRPLPIRDINDVVSSGCAFVIVNSPFLACLVAGLAVAWSFYFIPYLRYSKTSDWVETPCTLEECELRGVKGGRRGRSVVYIAATYRYVYEGKSYSSDRVDFVTHVLGGIQATGVQEDESREYVKSHPAGTETVCYVNPVEPSQAVLLPDRMPTWISAILPVILIAVGLIGLVAMANISRKARKRRMADPTLD